MRKLLIVGLMLIASGSVYSSGKEYTHETCKSEQEANSCDKCKVIGKVSFKVSKSLGSVMKTVTFSDGRNKSSTINNCKIFDDETFECDASKEAILTQETSYFGKSDLFILANGKWTNIVKMEEGTIGKEKYEAMYSYRCGTEIKNIYNLLK